MELEPDLVFLLFLPPILYGAGYFTSIRDFKANLRPILLLSVGLVLFTTVVVAVALKALVPDLPWAAAFAFGAIVSPPDAVAATAVFKRLRVPAPDGDDPRGREPRQRRDRARAPAGRRSWRSAGRSASSPRARTSSSSSSAASPSGSWPAWIAGWFTTRIQDPDLGIVLSLLVPALAYIPAEALGVSGVLAVVVAGIYAGRDRRPVAQLRPARRGHRRLEHRPVPRQRPRVHAHRAPAAGDPRGPRRLRRADAAARRGDEPDGHRHPVRVGVLDRVRVRAAPAAVPRPRPGRRAGAA